jgi:hypothetical protein
LVSVKRIFKSVKKIFTIALILVPITFACSNRGLGEENIVAEDLTVPQIDLDTPAVTETATFAMG